MFIYGFLILTETSDCVPVDINCNKEDMTIMSGLTQDDSEKISGDHLSILYCDNFYKRGSKWNKERW